MNSVKRYLLLSTATLLIFACGGSDDLDSPAGTGKAELFEPVDECEVDIDCNECTEPDLSYGVISSTFECFKEAEQMCRPVKNDGNTFNRCQAKGELGDLCSEDSDENMFDCVQGTYCLPDEEAVEYRCTDEFDPDMMQGSPCSVDDDCNACDGEENCLEKEDTLICRRELCQFKGEEGDLCDRSKDQNKYDCSAGLDCFEIGGTIGDNQRGGPGGIQPMPGTYECNSIR